MTAEQEEKAAWLRRSLVQEGMITALEHQLEKENWILQKAESCLEEAEVMEIRQKIADMRQKTAEYIHMLLDSREKIRKAIASLENDAFREILTRKYLCGETNEQIAEEMEYDVRTVQRKAKKAYDVLELPENFKEDFYA